MKSIPEVACLAFNSKVCSHCHETKPFLEFSRNQRKPDGLRSECKACQKQSDAQYQPIRTERKRSRKPAKPEKSPTQTPLKERKRLAQSRYRATNLEIVRARQALHQANYRARHPERTQEDTRKWKALKSGALGWYTPQEWQSLKARYNNCCLSCHRSEHDIVLVADHIVPLSKGGTNYIDNIQPLCLSCNSRKRNNHLCYRPDKLLPSPV